MDFLVVSWGYILDQFTDPLVILTVCELENGRAKTDL